MNFALFRFYFTAIFIVGFILFCFAPASYSQAPIERQQRILEAVENRDYATAFNELQSWQKADEKVFNLNNYDYLLARIAERRKDFGTAAANYQSVINRNSVLSEYALWHLSQIMRANGNLMLERTFLQQLLTTAPESLLNEAAKMRLARSYFESADYASTVKSLESGVWSLESKTPPADSKLQTPTPASRLQNAKERERAVLLALSFQRGGKTNEARDIFTRLVTQMPNPAAPDDFALAAARGLDNLDRAQNESAGKNAPNLPDFEHLRRALIYQFNRDFANARLHYQAIVERYPTSGNTPDAILQLGRIAVQENRLDDAITQFERVQAQFPDHPATRDALNFEASVYARIGNAQEALSRYEKFISKYVEDGSEPVDNPERPYLNIVDVLRDAGRDAEARQWLVKIREKFKNQLPAILAVFSQARIHLAEGNWNAALGDLTELENAPDLGGARVPGGTNKTEIAFLKAFCLEQLNRTSEAVNAYLVIPDGRNEYYGWRATERLKLLANKPQTRESVAARLNLFRSVANQAAAAGDAERARQMAQNALRLSDNEEIRREMLDAARRAYQVLPDYNRVPNAGILSLGRQNVLTEKPKSEAAKNFHQTLADELLFLNLYDEAAPELEAAWKAESPKSKVQSPKSEDQRSFSLAVFYKRGDLAQKAVAYAEPLWRQVPADYLLELAPRESVELLYPAPFQNALLEFAPPRGIDHRFLLSIMRQESRFRSDAKSIAAARGLMQFIPSTANEIAGQLNLQDFTQNDLYNPPTAILFGSQYLSNIFKQFPQQPQAVAAAYNGGEANTLRWLLRSRSAADPDRYVAEIQFTQSKDYVYKVLANYRVYQTLYDEQLKRK